MENQLISFETAKLAKEKGFEEYCFSYYNLKGEIKHNYSENGSSTDVDFRVDLEDLLDNFNRGIPNTYSAPTQSLLKKWLREIHKINVESNYLPNVEKYRCLFIPMTLKKPKDYSTPGEAFSSRFEYLGKNNYNTYEEALEFGLQEALKLIK